MAASHSRKDDQVPDPDANDSSYHDFCGLHNIAKHIIYLKEGSDAALAATRGLAAHHARLMTTMTSESSHNITSLPPSTATTSVNNIPPTQIPLSTLVHTMSTTHSLLEHKIQLYESTNIRLVSLEKRMNNLINLSFHLVTQADSMVMRQDSKAMTTIQYVTVVLLPITTVAVSFIE